MTRNSSTEDLYQKCRRIDIGQYFEMMHLIHRARRVLLCPMLYEVHGSIETPKWQILGVLYDGNAYHYWLVSLDNSDGLFSFTVPAIAGWPGCFELRLVPFDNIKLIAHPDHIIKHVKNVEDLHHSSKNSNYRGKKDRWLTIHKSSLGKTYDTLPLGKPYRAIDIGSFIPIFRLSNCILGLPIK